jgi:threonine/homoserine/homoserine lactone efflux protein
VIASYLIQGFTLGLVVITPGPFQAYIIMQTLEIGWKRALPASFAPLLSDGPIILLMVLILSQAPPWLLDGLRIAGGLYILWLAVRSLRSAHALDSESPPFAKAGPRTLFKAVLINLLNPNPYIFWGTVGARILLEGWRLAPVTAISFIAGFYATAITSLAGIILLFGTARRLGPRVTRILAIVSSSALLAFGLFQLGTGILAVAAP